MTPLTQGLGVAICATVGLALYWWEKPRLAGIVTIALVLIWGIISHLF
ncbi:MAG: hypothetical protein G01um101466_137 [Parcubacteria group bacterium Gr01-1014_66]|nr:MAG: hypothetical protein G01um101466_137 [Parcubacteria group bacterium Gr01-1014_66]